MSGSCAAVVPSTAIPLAGRASSATCSRRLSRWRSVEQVTSTSGSDRSSSHGGAGWGGDQLTAPTRRTFAGQSLRGYSKPSAVSDSSSGGRASRSSKCPSAGRPCSARRRLIAGIAVRSQLAPTMGRTIASRSAPTGPLIGRRPSPNGGASRERSGSRKGAIHRPRQSRGLGDGRGAPAVDVDHEHVAADGARSRVPGRAPPVLSAARTCAARKCRPRAASAPANRRSRSPRSRGRSVSRRCPSVCRFESSCASP